MLCASHMVVYASRKEADHLGSLKIDIVNDDAVIINIYSFMLFSFASFAF